MPKKVDSKQGKKRSAPKKRRRSGHRIEASKPAVKERIAALRRDWKRGADPVTLGRQILALTGKARCSFRGLGEQIRKPESTLRRYAMLASLPAEDRAALLRGETAKVVIARKAKRDWQERCRARLLVENETGSVSDEVADLILDFCRYEDGEEKGRCFGSQVDNLLSATRDITRARKAHPIPGKIPTDRLKLFACSRPKEMLGEHWIYHRAGWLAMILMTVAPEEDIREVAMNKAERRRFGVSMPSSGPSRR